MQQTSETALPKTIIDALHTSAEEMAEVETWIPPSRGITLHIARLASILYRANHGRAAVSQRRLVREQTLRMLAYAHPDLRLNFLIDLSDRDPRALNDLMLGDVDPSFSAYRFNIFASLGIFARHSLFNEVMSERRLRKVRSAMSRVAAQRATRKEQPDAD
jgi:hypothetical protein